MRRPVKLIPAVILAVVCAIASSLPVSAAEGGGDPVTAADVENGTYEITVDSDSSMFKIVACTLTVTDEGMNAHLTMSGQGFGKLFLGTDKEADAADESAFYPFGEDEEGRHTFDIPVSALDVPLPCAGWSIRKETWYPHEIVFRSDSLPEGAAAKPKNNLILPAAAACVGIAVIAVFAAAGIRRRKNAGEVR